MTHLRATKFMLLLGLTICAGKRLLAFDMDEALLYSKHPTAIKPCDPKNLCFPLKMFENDMGLTPGALKEKNSSIRYHQIQVRPGVPELLKTIFDFQQRGVLDVLFWTNNTVEKAQIYLRALVAAANAQNTGMTFEDFQKFGFISGKERGNRAKDVSWLKYFEASEVKPNVQFTDAYFLNHVDHMAEIGKNANGKKYESCIREEFAKEPNENWSWNVKKFSTDTILKKRYDEKEITLFDDHLPNCKNETSINVPKFHGESSDDEYGKMHRILKRHIQMVDNKHSLSQSVDYFFEQADFGISNAYDQAIDNAREEIKTVFENRAN